MTTEEESTPPEAEMSSSISSSSTSSSSVMRDDRKVLYLNLVILDASNAIDKQLSHKLKGVCQPLRQLATQAATTLATPARVAQALSEKLPTKLVQKMATKGLTTAAEVVFLEGPYVVLQFQVLSVSPTAMVEAQSKDFYDEFGQIEDSAKLDADWAATLQSWIQKVLGWIGIHRQRSLEDEYLPVLVQSKMETIMSDVLAGKLHTKGLQANSAVLPESSQCRFFFDTLRELRRAKEEMRPKYNIATAVATAQHDLKQRASKVREKVTSKLPKPKFPGKKVV